MSHAHPHGNASYMHGNYYHQLYEHGVNSGMTAANGSGSLSTGHGHQHHGHHTTAAGVGNYAAHLVGHGVAPGTWSGFREDAQVSGTSVPNGLNDRASSIGQSYSSTMYHLAPPSGTGWSSKAGFGGAVSTSQAQCTVQERTAQGKSFAAASQATVPVAKGEAPEGIPKAAVTTNNKAGASDHGGGGAEGECEESEKEKALAGLMGIRDGIRKKDKRGHSSTILNKVNAKVSGGYGKDGNEYCNGVMANGHVKVTKKKNGFSSNSNNNNQRSVTHSSDSESDAGRSLLPPSSSAMGTTLKRTNGKIINMSSGRQVQSEPHVNGHRSHEEVTLQHHKRARQR